MQSYDKSQKHPYSFNTDDSAEGHNRAIITLPRLDTYSLAHQEHSLSFNQVKPFLEMFYYPECRRIKGFCY